MKKKTLVLSLLIVCFLLISAFTIPANAITTYYHATVTIDDSGSLTGFVPIGGIVYLIMNLSVTGLSTWDDGSNIVHLKALSSDSFVLLEAGSEGIYIRCREGVGGTTLAHFVTVAISGNENLSCKFDSLGNMELSINDVVVYSDSMTAYAWTEALTEYQVEQTATGSFEGWITDSPLAPEPTPTPTSTPTSTPTPTATPTSTPTIAPTSWVHNTAVPIGGNIGGLNVIILLLFLGGIGLSVTLTFVRKLKDNLIEAIILMFIMGTAGIVAILWLIGGFA